MLKVRHFTVSWKLWAHPESDGSSKSLGQGRQKAGKVSETNILQLLQRFPLHCRRGLHGGVVVSTVISQRERSRFDSQLFSRGTPTSCHPPKTCMLGGKPRRNKPGQGMLFSLGWQENQRRRRLHWADSTTQLRHGHERDNNTEEEQLDSPIRQEWDNVPLPEVQQLVSSVPDVYRCCQKKRGCFHHLVCFRCSTDDKNIGLWDLKNHCVLFLFAFCTASLIIPYLSLFIKTDVSSTRWQHINEW